MSAVHASSLTGRLARGVWLLLAACDACLLVSLVLSYRWFAWEIPDASTPAAVLIYAILYGAIALATGLAACLVASIAVGIARQFYEPIFFSRWLMILAVIPLTGVVLTSIAWYWYVRPIYAIRDTARLDRFEIFDQLSKAASDNWWPIGLVGNDRLSIGLSLCMLIALAYLSEKYFMAWLRVRWPIPLVPIAMAASLVWISHEGERVMRTFVESQTWRAVAATHTFPEALAACEAIGPGWTLPRPAELRAFLSTEPESVSSWHGAVWTNTAMGAGGERAVMVELSSRRSGVWSIDNAVNRSVSACETDVRDRGPIDAFTRQRARLCEGTYDSPHLHSTDLAIVAPARGAAEPAWGHAGTVCVKRERDDDRRGSAGRVYHQQKEFSTSAAYLTYVKDYCEPLPWPRDFQCFTFAGDTPAFEENGEERLYRLACDYQGRVEGCEGYATLMDFRHDAERARRYRERASALGARVAQPARQSERGLNSVTSPNGLKPSRR